jgi:hypothetical protein
MEQKNRIIILGLMIFLSFFIINNIVEAADFEAWVGAPSLFTVGKTELVNIYVRNKDQNSDSFNITNYTKSAKNQQSQDVPHLVIVSIQSYKIRNLTTNETGDTFAKITILGPINSGNVTFNLTSDANPNIYHEVSIGLMTGSPIVLSEFDSLGVIQILLITFLILVVSYTSHIS